MKRKISLALALTFVISLVLMVLTACGAKQVPIYRGMKWADSSGNSKMSVDHSTSYVEALNGNGEDGDENAQYGSYKGDYVGKDTTLDDEKPFSEEDGYKNNLQGALENKFKGGNGLGSSIGGGSLIYSPTVPDVNDYFKVNYECLNIMIYNPDNFEIVSFTLNDEEYSSDMYENGSSMEKIFLKPKVNTSANGSITISISFVISNMKYRDGDELKDVIMEGNDTIDKDTSNQPLVATVSNMNMVGSTISFNVNLSKV